MGDDKKDIFSFELCSFPASIFKLPYCRNWLIKQHLADYLWTLLTEVNNKDTEFEMSEDHIEIVIDADALLHKSHRPKNES